MRHAKKDIQWRLVRNKQDKQKTDVQATDDEEKQLGTLIAFTPITQHNDMPIYIYIT